MRSTTSRQEVRRGASGFLRRPPCEAGRVLHERRGVRVELLLAVRRPRVRAHARVHEAVEPSACRDIQRDLGLLPPFRLARGTGQGRRERAAM
eukprot:6103558-Alexandrium_andersonii.AAC.1